MASWTAVFHDQLFHFLVIAFCLPNGVGCTNSKLFAMNGYIHVCFKTTFTYKCCFQTNTVLSYFFISKEKHPKARRWEDKLSQISNDCLLLSLMWLNEYGVFVSSRSLSDVVFSHWIWSFRLIKSILWYCIFSLNMKFSTIQYYALKYETWDDLVTLAWSRSSCIDLHW